MRRLALLLLLIPSLAHAKLMVVREESYQGAAATRFRETTSSNQITQAAREILGRFGTEGTDFVFVPANLAKTEFCRTGRMVWNYGTSSAYVESFDAVLHLAFNGKTTTLFPNYRPDSLTLCGDAAGASYPTVPQLMWIRQNNGFANYMADSTTDTTGMTGNSAILTFASGNQQFVSYAVPATGGPFFPISFVSATKTSNTTAPLGGLRKLLSAPKRSASVDPVGSYETGMLGGGTATPVNACAWCDSGLTAGDSLFIWERPLTGISGVSGKSSIIFAHVFGNSGCSDSTGSGTCSACIACEFDAQNAVISLARLDSLSGGRVFNKNKLPLRMGLVIRGGFNNYLGPSSSFPGVARRDSVSFKATCDSLATIPNFRAILETDINNVATFPYEKAWWSRIPGLRYSPTTYFGVRTGSYAGKGNASFKFPQDVWGYARSRPVFYNTSQSGGGAGSDTSLYTLLRSLIFHADSIFGKENVSHFLIPPNDDWSPVGAAASKDSILFAAAKAGASGILYNSQPWPLAADPRGCYQTQEEHYRTLDGTRIKLLGYSGRSVNASRMLFDVRSDSVNWSTGAPQAPATGEVYPGVSEEAYIGNSPYEASRAWNSLIFTRYRDMDFMPFRWFDDWDNTNTPTDDGVYGLRRGSVFVVSAQDLGSPTMDLDCPTCLSRGSGLQTRPAYWTLKSLSNAFQYINKLAGRTVVQFDWPENVNP